MDIANGVSNFITITNHHQQHVALGVMKIFAPLHKVRDCGVMNFGTAQVAS